MRRIDTLAKVRIAGFKVATPASGRPTTLASLDCAAIVIGDWGGRGPADTHPSIQRHTHTHIRNM